MVGRCWVGFTLLFKGRPRLRLVNAIRVAPDCKTVGGRPSPGTVCGSRENFRLWLDIQAVAVIAVHTSCERRVRNWLNSRGGWVNRRCAKVYGLNTDHDSAHSRVVAWRECVCQPLYCCSSFLEKRTNDLLLTQSRSIMEPLDLSQLPPELWYQQVKKLPRFDLITI